MSWKQSQPFAAAKPATIAPQPQKPAPTPQRPRSDRVLSIDALRGFDMFWIIGGAEVVKAVTALFVQPMPAAMQTQMAHAAWEGFTAWDLIMPLFLFVVGTAMPFSFGKRAEAGQTLGAVYRKVILRTLILFILGMAAQGHLLEFNLSKLHIYCNTLQAIAVGYLISAVLLLHLPVFGQVAGTAVLLAGYWALLVFVPIPGQGAGFLEEKRNLAMYIDELLLGRFRDGTTYTWILSGLAFAGTTMLGVLGGHVLRWQRPAVVKLLGLLLLGGICLAGGWYWSFRFPMIKHLFTSSFVLWSAGWSYMLLALFYLVVDVFGFRRLALFFIVIGSNAILAYMMTHLTHFKDFQRLTDTVVAGAAQHMGRYGDPLRTVCAFALIWVILLYLYRKKTFLRV